MSPEVRITKNTVRGKRSFYSFVTPDETGLYQTPAGEVFVDMSGVNPEFEVQKLVISFKNEKITRLLPASEILQVTLSADGKGKKRLKLDYDAAVNLLEPIRDPKDNWYKVKDANGSIKWVKRSYPTPDLL